MDGGAVGAEVVPHNTGAHGLAMGAGPDGWGGGVRFRGWASGLGHP